MTFNYKEIFKIFFSSFKQSFQWTLWKWLVTGGIGSLLGILKVGKDFGQTDNIITSAMYGVIALFSLFCLRFTLLFIKNSFKYLHEVYKNSVYGEAIILLKDSFAHLHHYRKTPGHQDVEFMGAMKSFCDNLKIIYDKITGSNCCVSIKVPIKDIKVTEHTIFVNLLRNEEFKKRDTKEYEEQKHTLIGNTPFSNSFNKVLKGQKDKYYINNDINNTPNYDNTSKECYENGLLPYESELVYPIVPIRYREGLNVDCMGFICIDSSKKNAFMGKYDVAIIEGVADGIYDLILERNNFKNDNPESM